MNIIKRVICYVKLDCQMEEEILVPGIVPKLSGTPGDIDVESARGLANITKKSIRNS